MLKEEISLSNISGIGPVRKKELIKIGIESINDILYFFPRRYEDRFNLLSLDKLQDEVKGAVLATVIKTEVKKMGRNKGVFKAYLENKAGKIMAIWFNQVFLQKKIKKGTKIYIFGKIKLKYGKQIIVEDYEIYSGRELKKFNKILPVYPATEKLSQKLLQKISTEVLEKYLVEVQEYLPEKIINDFKLLDLKDAIKNMHFPKNMELQKEARYRLCFDELLLFHLGLRIFSEKLENGIIHKKNSELSKILIQDLPYSLTKAQSRAICEIESDMEKPEVMCRLLQGDVGSGKTIVAAYAILKAVSGGFQAALMAPTEILAEQHFKTLNKLFSPLGISPILLKGNIAKNEKKKLIDDIYRGEHLVVIGTHALIQQEVIFANLGLIVIDEQHRFGVKQRSLLQQKGKYPDMLVMTATPIPRTLAKIFYSDLDLTNIDEMPPGRKRIKTYWVNESMRKRVYNFLRQEMKSGRQAYVICPLIEESEKIDVQNAFSLFQKLNNEIFPEFQLGLLHGKLNNVEKEEVMNSFRQGLLNLLVATTVVEVGVDVPNATIIIIENAERFGLSQLHQLRGRVGRGKEQSYCILFSDAITLEARKRMEIITKNSDGFKIAEEDLKLRGPGEVLGFKQHGYREFLLSDIVKDKELIKLTSKLADKIIEQNYLEKYPEFNTAIIKKFQEKRSINS